MRKTLLFLACIALVTLSSGCGNGYAGSCFISTDLCIDYTGSVYTGPEIEDSCVLQYSKDRCPSTDRIGRCRQNGGTPVESIFNYYSPGWEVDMAKSECEFGTGEWLGS